jgi:hypothetical protein
MSFYLKILNWSLRENRYEIMTMIWNLITIAAVTQQYSKRRILDMLPVIPESLSSLH